MKTFSSADMTIIIVMVNLAVMVLAMWAYRSVVAAIILLIPVNLSNFYLIAAMQMLGVGLDVNAGIGRGLTTSSDRWVLKLVLGFSF